MQPPSSKHYSSHPFSFSHPYPFEFLGLDIFWNTAVCIIVFHQIRDGSLSHQRGDFNATTSLLLTCKSQVIYPYFYILSLVSCGMKLSLATMDSAFVCLACSHMTILRTVETTRSFPFLRTGHPDQTVCEREYANLMVWLNVTCWSFEFLQNIGYHFQNVQIWKCLMSMFTARPPHLDEN